MTAEDGPGTVLRTWPSCPQATPSPFEGITQKTHFGSLLSSLLLFYSPSFPRSDFPSRHCDHMQSREEPVHKSQSLPDLSWTPGILQKSSPTGWVLPILYHHRLCLSPSCLSRYLKQRNGWRPHTQVSAAPASGHGSQPS